jgi:ankyrin repeat protein
VEASGLSIAEKTSTGQTALHVAAREGQDHVVEYLIQRGVDIDAR